MVMEKIIDWQNLIQVELLRCRKLVLHRCFSWVEAAVVAHQRMDLTAAEAVAVDH